MATDTKPLPSLSTDGWITSTPQKVDYMLGHFYASEITQTHMFPNNVHSLVNLVQLYKEDLVMLGTKVQESLRTYFGGYFPSVTARAQCRDIPNAPGQVGIHIFLEVRDVNGVAYNAANVVDIEDSKIMKISAINNGQ